MISLVLQFSFLYFKKKVFYLVRFERNVQVFFNIFTRHGGEQPSINHLRLKSERVLAKTNVS